MMSESGTQKRRKCPVFHHVAAGATPSWVVRRPPAVAGTDDRPHTYQPVTFPDLAANGERTGQILLPLTPARGVMAKRPAPSPSTLLLFFSKLLHLHRTEEASPHALGFWIHEVDRAVSHLVLADRQPVDEII